MENKNIKGVVDVEKLALKRFHLSSKQDIENLGLECEVTEWCKGYNQCLSDNVDKKFTLEDMYKAYQEGYNDSFHNKGEYGKEGFKKEFIQSLTKEEYNIIGEIRKDYIFVQKIL